MVGRSGDEDDSNEARVRGAMEVEASPRDRESDLPYPRHALPAHPGVADYVLFYPRSVQVYFSRLCARFGWRYVGPRVCRLRVRPPGFRWRDQQDQHGVGGAGGLPTEATQAPKSPSVESGGER